MRKRIPYHTKVGDGWANVHDQLDKVKFSSLKTERERLLGWNSEQDFFALTCAVRSCKGRVWCCAWCIQGVHSNRDCRDSKYDSHSSCFCLPRCALTRECFKQRSTGTHTLTEPLKGASPYKVRVSDKLFLHVSCNYFGSRGKECLHKFFPEVSLWLLLSMVFLSSQLNLTDSCAAYPQVT